MLNIFKRIFIGVAIAMSVFFLKTQVFALTVSSRLQYIDNNSTVDTTYVSAGSLMSITPATGHEALFLRVFVRFQQTFQVGSYYTFDYTYNVSRAEYEFSGNRCGTSLTVTTGQTIVSASCSSDGVAQHVIATVRIDSSTSYITLGSVYNVPLIPNQTYNFRVLTDYSVSEVDGTEDAVRNNTAIISNAIEGVGSKIDIQTTIINNIHNLLSGLVSSDSYTEVDYELNDPRSSSYIAQHNSLNSIGDSGTGSNGSGGLTFNSSNYEDASETIWDFIYDFLSLNSKLLTYLTSILTLGFTKVVLNR